MRRVVITGLGTVTPLGNDVPSTWESLLAGKSGIGPITKFDASKFDTKIAGEIKNFDAEKYIEKKETKRMDVFIQYVLASASQALADSGLKHPFDDPDRVGTIIGVGLGGLPT